MTCNVLMGTLDPTHSLTHSLTHSIRTLIYVGDRHGMPSDKSVRRGQVLTKSVNFLPAEEIDANVRFEVFAKEVMLSRSSFVCLFVSRIRFLTHSELVSYI